MKHKNTIDEFVRARYFNPHGTRKGAAIRASSGTTLPASLAAIANRGEWTISMVFEVYLGFVEPGDQYLGRLLAGFSPNDASFGCLPPHFECGMENKYVKEAMNLCFCSILDQNVDPFQSDRIENSLRSNTKAILLRCLALMVHHSSSLQRILNKYPNHPFRNIPILNDSSLLNELQKLITLKASDRIQMAIGVPPHVENIAKLEEVISLLSSERKERENYLAEIKKNNWREI